MDALIIPIVAVLIPIVIVPTALGIKHARFLREVEHAERMRAMDLGRPLAEDRSWTPASLAMAIGAGVPIGSMFIAFVASKEGPSSDAIWGAAATIGIVGVICGSILAAMQLSRREAAPAVEKPAYDPDEFDVVGRRG